MFYYAFSVTQRWQWLPRWNTIIIGVGLMHISGTYKNDTMWMIWYSDRKSYRRAQTLVMLKPNQLSHPAFKMKKRDKNSLVISTSMKYKGSQFNNQTFFMQWEWQMVSAKFYAVWSSFKILKYGEGSSCRSALVCKQCHQCTTLFNIM